MNAPLHERLAAHALARLEALIAAHLPQFRIPRVFAGHEVGADVRADLAFTIGLLGAYGVDDIAGVPVLDALESVLRPIDGHRTHSFFSYRVAETLLRHGSFDADTNPLLARFDEATRNRLAAACDSTSMLGPLAEGRLPRNYAAVLLRCEVDRQRLGMEVDPQVLEDLVHRTRHLLDANPGGYLDDSQSGIGRYDIYSGDIYLFTEPLADLVGNVWEWGARSALDLVERVGATNGAAFGWGRSSGALATCLTIELAGLAASRALVDEPGAWLARGANAFDHIGEWFGADGLITAHQYRSTFRYRGPVRRLQMTLDCLGKLADTAGVLERAAAGAEPDLTTLELFPPRDEMVVFDAGRRAGVWTYRSRDLAFVLPVVGSTVSDYLPAPHNPGLFEVPVDVGLPTGVPSIFSDGVHYTSGGLPAAVSKGDDRLSITYDSFERAGQFERVENAEPLPGRREVDYRVDGRTLRVDEHLTFEASQLPDAVALQIAETSGRPLRVEFRPSGPGDQATTIDVSGLKEYRSFWGELPLVHQIDLEPATEMRFGWSVTAKWRLLTTALTHHYHRSVYDPLAASDDVAERQISTTRLFNEPGYLDAWDVFHLHWPEWFLGPDPDRHRAAIAAIHDAGVRIVWTQHNLVPHDKDPRLPPIYALWAAAADGVIHHSEYGRRRVTERYGFRTDAIHRVIPHVHFGHLGPADAKARPEVGGEAPIRLGIVGAPRAEKDLQLVLDAFAAVQRRDVELAVFSLGPGDVVPDDRRITAVPYEMVDRAVYEDRLRSLDAIILPFVEGDMITTGTVGDVVGVGLAAVCSDWGYLAEVLGEAAIPYGNDLTTTIENLDRPTLDRAATAARDLQTAYGAAAVAAAHLELLEAVGTTRL